MKSFFIVKNELPRTSDEKFIVDTSDKKSGILESIKVNGLDVDKYTFYDESKLDEESKFVAMYHDSVFEIYFPTVKKPDNTYVYYPKPKIINTKDGTVYVNRWDEIDVSGMDISSMTYICDDSDKEEHQRVLMIYFNNPSSETKECE